MQIQYLPAGVKQIMHIMPSYFKHWSITAAGKSKQFTKIKRLGHYEKFYGKSHYPVLTGAL